MQNLSTVIRQKIEHLHEALLKRRCIFKEVQIYVHYDDNTLVCNELMKWLKEMTSANEIYEQIESGITIRVKEKSIIGNGRNKKK